MDKPREEVALVFDDTNKRVKIQCESKELPIVIVEELLNMLFNDMVHNKFKKICEENATELIMMKSIAKLGWFFAILMAVLLLITSMKG